MEDRVNSLVAEYGDVPPAWFMFPDTHPYDIIWRMGRGETHMMVFSVWWKAESPKFDEVRRVEYFRKYPPQPRWLTHMIDLIWDLDPTEADDPEEFDYSSYWPRVEALGFGTRGEFEKDFHGWCDD